MSINIWGLVSIIIFFLLFPLVGVWASRKKKIADKYSNVPKDERFLLSGRNIGWVVGTCSMTG